MPNKERYTKELWKCFKRLKYGMRYNQEMRVRWVDQRKVNHER